MALKQIKVGSSNLLVDAMASIGGTNGLICLRDDDSNTASHFSSLLDVTTAAAYQVTAGKTLYIFAASMFCGNAAGLAVSQIGYGSASVSNSVSAPAGQKLFTLGFGSPAAIGWFGPYAVWWRVPAAQFPYIKNGAGSCPNFTFLGFEE